MDLNESENDMARTVTVIISHVCSLRLGALDLQYEHWKTAPLLHSHSELIRHQRVVSQNGDRRNEEPSRPLELVLVVVSLLV